MIPISDLEWKRVPEEYLELPKGHHAEYARTGSAEITARIVGPNAHVFGKDETLWDALEGAIKWFDMLGNDL